MINHAKNKAEYMAEGRTYCVHCGNSDADMEIDDDRCYDCKHPEEAKANARRDLEEYLYVYGEPDGPYDGVRDVPRIDFRPLGRENTTKGENASRGTLGGFKRRIVPYTTLIGRMTMNEMRWVEDRGTVFSEGGRFVIGKCSHAELLCNPSLEWILFDMGEEVCRGSLELCKFIVQEYLNAPGVNQDRKLNYCPDNPEGDDNPF